MKGNTVADLYQHFDELVEQDAEQDILFASSYLRGFVALAASEFGDESQLLSAQLSERISAQLHAARTELTPNDRQLVNHYWQSVNQSFSS